MAKCERCGKNIAANKAKAIWGHLLCPCCTTIAKRAIERLLSKLALPDDEFQAWVEQECTPPGDDLPEWAA